jgi:hypothetical protein
MANIDLLISKLDHRLRSLHQEQLLVEKVNGADSLEQRYISDYIQITKTGSINPGIEFTILDALSKYFNLYEDDLERQQILAAMAGELKSAARHNILASTKIIQNNYPSIYLLTQESLTQIKASSPNIVVKLFLALDTRSKLIVGVAVLISASILGGKISSIFNRSPDNNPSTSTTSLATPDQTIAPNQDVVNQQTPSPEEVVSTAQLATTQDNSIVSADRQTGLETLSYRSHCTLLPEQNTSENIIDDNCNISQTIDLKNYTLSWTNGETYNIEIITDQQAIIDGEQATIIQKNSNGITISFSKGRVGWELKS